MWELESAEGWINVSRWGNLTHRRHHAPGAGGRGWATTSPAATAPISQKHWWVGLSGGVSIDAASGLPGGGLRRTRPPAAHLRQPLHAERGSRNQHHRLRCLCAARESSSGARSGYGSGSGTVTASGILGQLSAAFYALGGFEAQVDFALGSVTTGTPYPLLVPAGRCRRTRRRAHRARGVPTWSAASSALAGMYGWTRSIAASSAKPPALCRRLRWSPTHRGPCCCAEGSSSPIPRCSSTAFRQRATVNLGSGLLLSLDGDIRVLPHHPPWRRGTAYANISLPGGNLRGATISLGGSVTVSLLVTRFNTGFSANLNDDCFRFKLWDPDGLW
jgi:hypothetical protein